MNSKFEFICGNELIKQDKKFAYFKCNCGVEYKKRLSDLAKTKYNMCNKCSYKYRAFIYLKQFETHITNDTEFIILSDLNYYIENKKVILRCSCGNEYINSPSSILHSKNKVCPKCNFKIRSNNQKIEYEEVFSYIESKGCVLLTKKEDYINSAQKLKIKCSCGNGEFCKSFSIFKYKDGGRCDNCFIKLMSEINRRDFDSIVYFVKNNSDCEILSTKLDYINNRSILKFKCKCGNVFYSNFHEFQSGNKRQCNGCGKGSMSVTDFLAFYKSKNMSDNCELISFINKNGFVECKSSVVLKCSCGEVFETKKFLFTDRNRTRCDMCISKFSNGELKIETFLNKYGIHFKKQYTFKDCRGKRKPLPFDFCILSNTDDIEMLVEYDGIQHFKPSSFGSKSNEQTMQNFINIIENDNKKNEYCFDNNYKLIRIPYWDFDRIEEILHNELK